MHALPALPNQGIQPIETLVLPPALDGSQGTNREVPGQSQLAAETDLEAISAWLARRMKSKATFDSYRREVERLLLWSLRVAGKPFSSLTHEDMVAYKAFLRVPEPASSWITDVPGARYSRTDPRWRPFAGPLSDESVELSVRIVDGLFTWLVEAGYLRRNPLALSRERAAKREGEVTRFLDQALWAEVKVTIEGMPRVSDRDRKRQARARWLFALLFLCGLRISEVTGTTMSAFKRRRNREGEKIWWLEVNGKGDVDRSIPVSEELVIELERYRREVGATPLPAPDDDLPLILPLRKGDGPLERNGIHNFVKDVFATTAERLAQRGPDWMDDVLKLRQASTHWMRHTAGSRMAEKMDLVAVRDNLGHRSVSTTSIYLHTESERRHEVTVENHRM